MDQRHGRDYRADTIYDTGEQCFPGFGFALLTYPAGMLRRLGISNIYLDHKLKLFKYCCSTEQRRPYRDLLQLSSMLHWPVVIIISTMDRVNVVKDRN